VLLNFSTAVDEFGLHYLVVVFADYARNQILPQAILDHRRRKQPLSVNADGAGMTEAGTPILKSNGRWRSPRKTDRRLCQCIVAAAFLQSARCSTIVTPF
jgi:hypothetical protein